MWVQTWSWAVVAHGRAFPVEREMRKRGVARHNPEYWSFNGWQLAAGECAMSVLCLTARRPVDTAPLYPVGRS